MAKDNAKIQRMRVRADTVRVREDFALAKYAAGATIVDITLALADTFGTSVTSVSNTWEMTQRALRRHAVKPEDVEAARARILLHLDKLLEAWLPRALGLTQAPDGSLMPPSDKAATIVLQTLDRLGQVTGAIKPPEKPTNINVNVIVPADAESRRHAALDELRREAAKLIVIDGELTGAGTSLEATRTADHPDRQALLPPPAPIRKEQP